MIGNGNENDADQGETDFDPDEERQWKQDLEHLRLLSIFHYIVGGLTFYSAAFPSFTWESASPWWPAYFPTTARRRRPL